MPCASSFDSVQLANPDPQKFSHICSPCQTLAFTPSHFTFLRPQALVHRSPVFSGMAGKGSNSDHSRATDWGVVP